jgi:ribonucleoside-diphosphate reductase alpha chain
MATSATHSFNGALLAPPPSYLTHHGSSSQVDRKFQVIRRNGSFSPFDATKISVAITKAFVAVEGPGATSSRRIHEAVEALTHNIVETLSRRADPARAIHIEDIQDQVELALMRSGEHKVARAYVLYREERTRERRRREERSPPPSSHNSMCDWKMAVWSRSTNRALSRRSPRLARASMEFPLTP